MWDHIIRNGLDTENELLSSIEEQPEKESEALLETITGRDGAVERNLTDILRSVYKNETAVFAASISSDHFLELIGNVIDGMDAEQLKRTAKQLALEYAFLMVRRSIETEAFVSNNSEYT